MAGGHKTIWLAALILIPGSIAMSMRHWSPGTDQHLVAPPKPLDLPTSRGMILLPGGAFVMGSAAGSDSQRDLQNAQPIHRVRVESFWIDTAAVTNRQFQRFVEQTGYETEAERKGSSLVFDRKLSAWREVVGVSWRHPDSPDSSLVGREDHPVVQVTWQDAATYAAWAKKRLPTEAEWEYAARGGLNDGIYAWGRKLKVADQHVANGWQGHFPDQDHAQDGFHGTSPVRYFPPNRYGLFDMAGNVWNWCSDWYSADYYGASLSDNPRGPNQGSQRVRRGGSWLSASNYEGALRVAYRGHAQPSESTNHTGFRCVRDADTP